MDNKVLVKNIDGKLYVEIPSEYKKPYWADFFYKEKYKEQEDGSLIFPCRNCNVTITKPILQQTSMGMIQTSQTFVENWVYFDVPQISALVSEGNNLLDTWTEEQLGLELKEKIEEIKDETKETEIKSGEENVS